MDFAPDEEQRELQQRIVAFAHHELNEGLQQRDEQRIFNRHGWSRCAAQGVLSLTIPQQYGGGGHDALTTAMALEGLGYGCMDNGLLFAIGAHLWGCVTPILAFGTEEQKARWLPALGSGAAIGALAITEREAGSDATHLCTTATREGDHYRLNGHKLFVTNGPVADVIVVLATANPELGNHGLAAFLVEREQAGLTPGPPIEKMGLHTAAMGEIFLTDCLVPAQNMLGSVGAGMALFTHAMLWERGLIMAPAVGAMRRQLERCTTYAQGRRQFGQPIGKFQLVSSRLVDIRLRLESAQLLLYKMAWRLARGERAHEAAALTKLAISEAWVATCQDALQIHGGYGYLTGSGIERDVRDSLASRLYSGTSEIQRQVIAQWMGVG